MPANPPTTESLKSRLWQCAEILRGSAIDRTDWKGYILPLLFFKRISDVWDEETAKARGEYGATDQDDFPELHRFTLPDGCHWQDLRETPVNVGKTLSRAMREIEHVERAGGDPRTFFGRIFGQEKNLTTSAIARMNLVLHGIEDFRIEQGDTLRNPAFTDRADALARFDCVIANPPFSLKEWGRDVWEADPWGRAAFGLPPANYGDYAWVSHMVASMAEGSGRMAVVLPQGVLFRKGAEGRIRRALLEQDLIEAVIGLAPNVFYGTGLAPAVVTLRRAKPRGRFRKVIVIDASSLFRKGRAQNFLDPAHAKRIVGWVRRFRNVKDRAKVVSTDDSEYIGDLIQRDLEESAKFEALRAAIQEGLDSGVSDKTVSTIKREVEARLRRDGRL